MPALIPLVGVFVSGQSSLVIPFLFHAHFCRVASVVSRVQGADGGNVQCGPAAAAHTDGGFVFEEPLVVEDAGLSAINGDPDVMGLASPLRLGSTRLVSPSSSGGTENPQGHTFSLCLCVGLQRGYPAGVCISIGTKCKQLYKINIT